MHEHPVIFEPVSPIQLSRSIYKVTSYIEFAPYIQSFGKFEAYLVNVTNDLNSPDIMRHFSEADTTQLAWERSKICNYSNHYNCSEVC